jgi:uncharacterized protein
MLQFGKGALMELEIETPCNKICTIDAESGLCIGCFRTMEEVARWGRMNPNERRRIMSGLDEREHKIAPNNRYQRD